MQLDILPVIACARHQSAFVLYAVIGAIHVRHGAGAIGTATRGKRAWGGLQECYAYQTGLLCGSRHPVQSLFSLICQRPQLFCGSKLLPDCFLLLGPGLKMEDTKTPKSTLEAFDGVEDEGGLYNDVGILDKGYTKKDQREMQRLGKRQELIRNFRPLSALSFTVLLQATWEFLLMSAHSAFLADPC